jgi:hypothetical protein
MAVEKIPQVFRYTCDVCKRVHVHTGPYVDSRPPDWAQLTLAQDAHDFQGAAVADATIKRLLCDKCAVDAGKVLNAWASGIINTEALR